MFSFEMRVKAVYLLVCAAVLVPAGAIATAATKPSKPRSIVLGKTAHYPPPGCPGASTCEVVARVTGVQMAADGVAQPFRVPKPGILLSWWLKLPRLRPAQLRSFNSFFGGEPSARIAVLRRSVKGRFRLIAQGPTTNLLPDLGDPGRARYKLPRPLRVQAGDYIGLSAVTWVPAFAINLDATQNSWLASRPRKLCATPSSKEPKRFAAYYKLNQAHLQPSTAKLYQCTYQTARLLYWARIVPDTGGTRTP